MNHQMYNMLTLIVKYKNKNKIKQSGMQYINMQNSDLHNYSTNAFDKNVTNKTCKNLTL